MGKKGRWEASNKANASAGAEELVEAMAGATDAALPPAVPMFMLLPAAP